MPDAAGRCGVIGFPRFVTAFIFTVSMSVSGGLLAALIHDDPEHARPDRTARPAAGAPQAFDAALPVEVEISQIFEAERVAREAAEQEAERARETEARASAEREAAVRAAPREPAPSVVAGPPSVAVECGNTVLPDEIIRRESGGNCDAYNPTGCGGRGCIGYAQVDAGHFWAVSPWNPNVPGTCYGLGYNECVERLWAGGSGASHWR
jgi:hypothetical protein